MLGRHLLGSLVGKSCGSKDCVDGIKSKVIIENKTVELTGMK